MNHGIYRNLKCICLIIGLMPTPPLLAQERLQVSSEVPDYSMETAVPYFSSAVYEREPVREYPTDPAAYYLLVEKARELRNANRCAEAIPLFQSAVEQFDGDGSLWLLLGLCQEQAGYREDAIHSFKQSLSLGSSPFDQDLVTQYMMPNRVMAKIGWLYAEMGEEQSAVEWLRRSVDARLGTGFLHFDERAALLMHNDAFRQLAGLPSEGATGRNEEWVRDIDYLGWVIRTTHYDPDHRTSARELAEALEALKSMVPELSDKQILARLSVFMGKYGAGHDFVFGGTGTREWPEAFAFKAYFFTDGLYVIEAGDPELVGARIDLIAGMPTAEVLARLQLNMARDNNMTALWNVPKIIRNPWLLEAHGIVSAAADVTFTITDRNGSRREVRPGFGDTATSQSPQGLAPLVAGNDNVPLYLSRMDEFYFVEPLNGADALYIQMNSVQNMANESIEAFAARVQALMSDPNVEHVILDLRHNIGGSYFLVTPFVQALIAFAADPEKGELFVLTSRYTFSSAQILLTVLDEYAEPIVAGEPSGSRPNFIGEVSEFRLPHSGVSGSISSQYYQASTPQDHRIWTAPDVPVGLSSGDYFAGRDPVLDVARRIISAGATP